MDSNEEDDEDYLGSDGFSIRKTLSKHDVRYYIIKYIIECLNITIIFNRLPL
jgi:hypothetical protein